MNVTSIRKSLQAGEWPAEGRDSLHLNGKQIHHLEATVPCVKMISSTGNSTFYFPDSGASLTTWLTHGISLHSDYVGDLHRGADDQIPCYEDGTSHYVASPGGPKPMVYTVYHAAQASAEAYTGNLWLARKPYKARVEGYESVHTKGWPKDQRFGLGRDKISLHVHDGDFKSYYLAVSPLANNGGMDWVGSDLAAAIKRGEFDGSETPSEFADRLAEETAERQRRIERKLEFERFIRYDPMDEVRKAVDAHNQSLDAAKAFLRMATKLRRHMKQNPGWYKKAKVPAKGHRNSELFKFMEQLKESDRQRRESDVGLERATYRFDR